MDTVEENLGLELDDYIVIDFVAFQDFIDAIGGIEVEVDCAFTTRTTQSTTSKVACWR